MVLSVIMRFLSRSKELLPNRILFHKRHQHDKSADAPNVSGISAVVAAAVAPGKGLTVPHMRSVPDECGVCRGKCSVAVRVSVNCQGQLFEIVRTLHPPRGLAGRLDSGQKKPYQDADDRDHDQQFDQRKTCFSFHYSILPGTQEAGGGGQGGNGRFPIKRGGSVRGRDTHRERHSAS